MATTLPVSVDNIMEEAVMDDPIMVEKTVDAAFMDDT